jgi:hypothetical protein
MRVSLVAWSFNIKISYICEFQQAFQSYEFLDADAAADFMDADYKFLFRSLIMCFQWIIKLQNRYTDLQSNARFWSLSFH